MEAPRCRADSTDDAKFPGRYQRTMTRGQQWRLWISGLFGSRYDGLSHFAVVHEGVLYRCGQPSYRDLRKLRERLGFRTIVCARGGTRNPLRNRWYRRERAFCRERGIAFVHLPFSDEAAVPGGVLERFVEVMRDESARPVLLHCEQGVHRTSILCAAYRVAVQSWPLAKAVDEMREMGFVDSRQKREPLLAALREYAALRAGDG